MVPLLRKGGAQMAALPSSHFLFFSLLLSTLILFRSTSLATAAEGSPHNSSSSSYQEADRVLRLPGQPAAPSVSQFSGYITVNQQNGRALFYWFFEAQSQPSSKPLLLWFNGGPGCSSIGYGAAVELGPLLVQPGGSGLQFNRHTWSNVANLLFVESPVGVGFSYTNTSSDLSKLDDGFVAEDAHSFVVNWLERFPQYQSRDLYLSGESYAGHYVPQLAELIFDRNKDSSEKSNHPQVNLKGFIVGNPETEDYYDSKGLVEYAWSHAVVSDQLFLLVRNVCDFTLTAWKPPCLKAVTQLFQEYRDIDIYNIYAPKCHDANATGGDSTGDGGDCSSLSSSSRVLSRMRTVPAGGYDPCYSSYVERYFNRADVQRELRANATGAVTGSWKVCNNSILRTYNFTVASVLPIYTKLIKAGMRIWIYSGDADGRVPVIGTRYCVEALGLPLKTPWRAWYLNRQVAGRFVEYEGLTMATVRGAGHLVPLNKPAEALQLVAAFLQGRQLPVVR